MEHMHIILWIQKSLEEYRKFVKILEKENVKEFSGVVLKGIDVCVPMLEFILIQNGITVRNGMVFLGNNDDGVKKSMLGQTNIINYCSCNKNMFPDECRRFLKLIYGYRNQAVHGFDIDRKMAIQFSKAIDYFTAWFTKQYINKENVGTEFENIRARIFSIENILSKEEYEIEVKTSDVELTRQLLEKIDVQTNIIVNLTKQVTKIDERSERIENAINEIDKKLQELTRQIGAYQSLIERQIEKVDSDIEKDRIIQGYADECVERIVKATNATAEKRALEVERRKLVASIGEHAWDKLDDASKTFLVSAKIMYNHLILLGNQTDYSGVCVLITKALEVELSKRFYTRFLKYLDDTYKMNYSKYHTALLYNGLKPLKPEKFTMGSIAFAMCYLENKYDSEAQKKQNKEKLLEYSKKKLFPEKSDDEINVILNEYAVAIENIRKDYRNPSAHTDELCQVDAEKCFNLVLDVEKLLKKMLDSFYE